MSMSVSYPLTRNVATWTKVCLAVFLVLIPLKVGATPRAVELLGKIPLSFEENRGQTAPQARFMVRAVDHSVFLSPSQAVVTLAGANRQSGVVRMSWIGADPGAPLEALEPLPGRVNYFLGNDPAKWIAGIPTYARLAVPRLYPGVRLEYHGDPKQLEYDLIVAPGNNPDCIRFAIEGGRSIRIDAEGRLVIATSAGDLFQHRPVAYQEMAGVRRQVDASYVLRGKDLVGFTLGDYDHHLPLVIDPVLSLSYAATLSGTTGDDAAFAVALDSSNNAYVTGKTFSTDFPTSGAFQSTKGAGTSGDAFVTKIDTGAAIVYSTYLGGSGDDSGQGIAVDSSGNAYVAGYTSSSGTAGSSSAFPTTTGAFKRTNSGGTDAFVTKLDSSGSALSYSTYLGGSSTDRAFAIAVDSGAAFVTGDTSSTNFPLAGAFQTTRRGLQDAFVTKLKTDGSGLTYSTYLGGNFSDQGLGIALGPAPTSLSGPSAYIVGGTSSSSQLATTGAYQTTYGGSTDAFIARLNPTLNGVGLAWATYLGGTDLDRGYAIAVAADPSTTDYFAYVTGEADSTNFPTTAGAYITTFQGGIRDAFVTKINDSGTTLSFSTFLGGTDADVGLGIAVNAGKATVTGETSSTDFPTANAYKTTIGGAPYDVFLTRFTTSGAGVDYSSYLNLTADGSTGYAVAVDSTGDPYVAGEASIVTTDTDAYVVKFHF